MLILKKHMRSICLGVTLIFLLAFSSFGQVQKTEDLLNRKINLNLRDENLFQICASLTYFEKIPIGLEAATGFSVDNGKKSIDIKKGTLREVLDSIVKQEPNYKWEVRDAVVNIYPVNSRDEILKILLETKIESFSTKKEMGRREIRDRIDGLNQITTFLNLHQLKLATMIKTDIYASDATTDINLTNTNLRGVLNKVVNESGDSKFWSIYRLDNGKLFLSF